jgi:hypothetical protein
MASLRNFVQATTFGNQSWAMTDLLVNYEGGFVRRGLVGQFSLLLGNLLSIPVNLVAIFITSIAFIYVTYIVITENKSFPTFLLFTPVFLGSAAYGQFIVRKDFIMIAFLIFSIRYLLQSHWTKANLICLNFLLVVGTLIHEAFFFLFLGAILNAWRLKSKTFSALLGTLYRIPTLLPLSFVPFLASGSPQIANRINQSLIPTWEAQNGVGCCNSPQATIESIGWSLGQGLELPKSLLDDFSHGIWIPLGWILSFLFALYVATRFLIPTQREEFCWIFGIQTLAFLPIIIVGWDYGRWGFLIFCSTFLIFNSSHTQQKLEFRTTNSHKWPYYILALGTALPICCWSVEIYAGSTSVGYLYFNIIKPLFG